MVSKIRGYVNKAALAGIIGLAACSPKNEVSIYSSDKGLLAYDPFVSDTTTHEVTRIRDVDGNGSADCVVIYLGQVSRRRPHDLVTKAVYAAAREDSPEAQACAVESGLEVAVLTETGMQRWTELYSQQRK